LENVEERRLSSTASAPAAACYAARRSVATRAGKSLELPSATASALADLLPVLICGEASAEAVFGVAAGVFADRGEPLLAAALRSVAQDEQRHTQWLAELRAGLPAPSSSESTRAAARFLRRLASDRLAVHLCRVAALDAAVCVVLARACARGTPVEMNSTLLGLFIRIRRDEGRHVRISRRCAAALGADRRMEFNERRLVATNFAELLRSRTAALSALGIEPESLRHRLLGGAHQMT
jgi:hypothetical protein